jgi:NAD(P)H-dependent flavin oxidoreductase YrpB (nitropropane dioxygenase family)
MAGQSAGLVKKIEPAAAIIEDLINGAAAEIERLKRFAD